MNKNLLIVGVILLLIVLIWGYITQGWFRTVVPVTGAAPATPERTIRISVIQTTPEDKIIYEEEKALVTELNTSRLTEARRNEILNRLTILYGSGNTKTGHFCCSANGHNCTCAGWHCCRKTCRCTVAN